MSKFSLLSRMNNARYDEGHSAGWQEGFDIGSKNGVREAKKVFIKLLQKEAKSANIELVAGLEQAIKIIKEHK